MKQLISFALGLLFGLGLILTGMYSPDVILSGLKIGAETFSLDLYVTFTFALLTTFLIFQLKRFVQKPITNSSYQLPTKANIDWQLVIGATLFGIGWGMSGICPGPNVVGLGTLIWPLYWINFAGIIIGYILAKNFIINGRTCQK